MIQQQTILRVCDNSGAKDVKCIKVLGGYQKRFAQVGDIIVVCVLSLRAISKKTSKVKKGCLYKALIIRTKKSIRKNGQKNFAQVREPKVLLFSGMCLYGTKYGES